MGEIQFEFSLEKLIHAIAFFAHKNIPDLTKLKVAKLLYFADRSHLLGHGRPILGDVYWCMDFGPVPSFALNEMSEAIDRSEVTAAANSEYGKMSQVLRVRRSLFSRHPHFEARKPYDPGVFSSSELAVLDEIAIKYGKESTRRLVDLTHAEATWLVANESRAPKSRTPIPYELFFEGAPQESRKHLARLKADYSNEVIPLESDTDYSNFATGLRSYVFEPELDLDSDHLRERTPGTVSQT